MILNKVLKDIRVINGMAQKDLARAIGKDPAFVSRLESSDDEHHIKLGILIQYSAIFHIRLTHIMYVYELLRNGETVQAEIETDELLTTPIK